MKTNHQGQKTGLVQCIMACALLVPGALAVAQTKNAPDWRAIIQDAGLPLVDHAADGIAAVHGSMKPDAKEYDITRAGVEALVHAASLPFTDAELIGNWRCRSIQGSPDIIIAYPYFPCRIERRDSKPYLIKSSGSQFRRGFLYPDAENARRIFLGVSYVSDDKPGGYSGLVSRGTTGDLSTQFDSVGVLTKIGPAHFILILDSTPKAYEIYEFDGGHKSGK